MPLNKDKYLMFMRLLVSARTEEPAEARVEPVLEAGKKCFHGANF
jgi:hypothetical protein